MSYEFTDQLKLTIKHWLFIVECYAKHISWKTSAKLFAIKFKNGNVLGETSINVCNGNFWGKLRETVSVSNKNCYYPKRVQTPENISQTKESLEQHPAKSIQSPGHLVCLIFSVIVIRKAS